MMTVSCAPGRPSRPAEADRPGSIIIKKELPESPVADQSLNASANIHTEKGAEKSEW
jgi:hypothetical protein